MFKHLSLMPFLFVAISSIAMEPFKVYPVWTDLHKDAQGLIGEKIVLESSSDKELTQTLSALAQTCKGFHCVINKSMGNYIKLYADKYTNGYQRKASRHILLKSAREWREKQISPEIKKQIISTLRPAQYRDAFDHYDKVQMGAALAAQASSLAALKDPQEVIWLLKTITKNVCQEPLAEPVTEKTIADELINKYCPLVTHVQVSQWLVGRMKEYALHNAVQDEGISTEEKIERIQDLAAQAVDINCTIDGETAFCRAVQQNPADYKLLAFLKSLGSQIDKGKQRFPLIVEAQDNPRGEMLDWLLREGASINKQDNSGRTALSAYVTQAGNDPNAVAYTESLIRQGADPAIKDKKGYNALHYAVFGLTDSIVPILAPLCPLEEKTTEGRTVLQLAVDGLEVALEGDNEDDEHEIDTIHATQQKFINTLHAILALNPDPSVCSQAGFTPLEEVIAKCGEHTTNNAPNKAAIYQEAAGILGTYQEKYCAAIAKSQLEKKE